MSTIFTPIRHIWVGRPVKSSDQPLELALVSENGTTLPQVEVRIAPLDNEPGDSDRPIEGELITDFGPLLLKPSNLTEGAYQVSIAISEYGESFVLPETIVILSETDLREYLSGSKEGPIGPFRILAGTAAEQQIFLGLMYDMFPYVPRELMRCRVGEYLPDELTFWIVSSLMDDLRAVDAFGVSTIHLSITSGGKRDWSASFWQPRDHVEIEISASVEYPLSEVARNFYFHDELGFGGKLRCEPELETKISMHSDEKGFVAGVSVSAPSRHFVDFVVFVPDAAENIARFRDLVARRPSLAGLEVPLFDEKERRRSMVFRMTTDQAQDMRDLFSEVAHEWFTSEEGRGRGLGITNVDANRGSGGVGYYYDVQEIKKIWFF
jgi:hypothetical protein